MNLRERLEHQLTAYEFSKLHEKIGLTRNKLTRAFTNPGALRREQIVKLSNSCMIPMLELINDYKCGFDTLTLKDADELVSVTIGRFDNHKEVAHA